MATVTRCAAEYERLCRDLGLLADDERVIVNEGSKTYGRAFRVNLMRAGSSAHFSPPAGMDFLGWTKREAWDVLADRCAVLTDVLAAQHRAQREAMTAAELPAPEVTS